MYRSLGVAAAAVILAAIAVPGPAAATEQRQDPGIQKQVSGEEFSAQRRRYVRRYNAPRRYYGRRYVPRYGYAAPYPAYGYGYGYGYPYRYYNPGPVIRFGPFGFGAW